jgi:hypothetical protein
MFHRFDNFPSSNRLGRKLMELSRTPDVEWGKASDPHNHNPLELKTRKILGKVQ